MVDQNDLFLAELEKDFGKDSYQNIKDLQDPTPNFTGSLQIDIDLGTPCPEGLIIEIYGEASSGKTTLAMELLGQARYRGKQVAYLNAEKNINRSFINGIKNLNVSSDDNGNDLKDLILLSGETGEENFKIAEHFLRSFQKSVLVIDSVDALVPEAELKGEVGDQNVGLHARLMSRGCRRLKEICSKNSATVVFINQMRSKIMAYGDPNTTPGGRALGYYASQRILIKSVSKAQQITDDKGKTIGHNARYFISKNKLAPPYIEGSFPIIYGRGISREIEVVKLLKDLALVKTGGRGCGMIEIEEKMYGRNSAAELFVADKKLFHKYEEMIVSNYFDDYYNRYEI